MWHGGMEMSPAEQWAIRHARDIKREQALLRGDSMKLVKVDYQEPNVGHMLINVERIIYIVWHETNHELNKAAYAQVFFSEGRPCITLNATQYQQLMRDWAKEV